MQVSDNLLEVNLRMQARGSEMMSRCAAEFAVEFLHHVPVADLDSRFWDQRHRHEFEGLCSHYHYERFPLDVAERPPS